MKTLVLTAHPDDLEISCGGTVAKIVDQGGTVDNFILCPYQDHKKHLPETSKILGFNVILNEVKERPKLDHNLIGSVENQLDMQSYDLLITHWKEDWHQDHRICHDVGNTLRRKQPLEVWYMNAFPYCQKYSTFEANVYSDISSYIDKKREAVGVYKNINSRWNSDIEAMSKFRGTFINVEHAEVFKADTIIF